ncbi:MAG TPA: ATP-binding cassette domain-containing protein [Burkholderiaceae bacterium]|nr:ATP-binding cassette domain-containing protein [Burkholderiaceae bacterium]
MLLELKRLRRLHVGPLDLAVEAGHCISISGRSGGGKSVILRSIADLDPHEGEVFLEGRACSSMPAPQWRRQVTYVAAESGWWEDTVRPHFPPSTDFAAILPPLGLDASVADRSINGLSTGERQRLALLRALCLQSKVLLLDEPTSALDHESVLQVEEVLKKRLAQGTAILLVTHDVEQARRLASRHLHLDAGQLEEISADALVHSDEVPELVK